MRMGLGHLKVSNWQVFKALLRCKVDSCSLTARSIKI